VKPVSRRSRRRGKGRAFVYLGVAAVVVVVFGGYFPAIQGTGQKPVILYVDQGNGLVSESNFGALLSFASSQGFNTVFFQVYREGALLFNGSQLSYFVDQTHSQSLEIFFALYFTNATQAFPTAVLGVGEDGISLDMSALSLGAQESLLADLGSCHCKTAVTTTNMDSPLKPDLLVLETYGPSLQQYVRHGIIASVGVFATSSKTDYQQQHQYALNNSDGVMVFDYAGLLKNGY
jgi:hypothetical protein